MEHECQKVSCRGESEKCCMLQFLQPLRGHGLRSRRKARGKARRVCTHGATTQSARQKVFTEFRLLAHLQVTVEGKLTKA